MTYIICRMRRNGATRITGSRDLNPMREGTVRKGVCIVGTLMFVVWMTSALSAAPAKGTVTIVHGVPGFTADIYLDGELLLDGFEPTSTAGPLRVAPASYDVDIREVGASADSPPVLSGRVRVAAGSSISIVAHLTPTGDPTLSVFHNSFERLPAGRALLVVRNVAAASPLAVRLDGRHLKETLREGGERRIVTAPRRHMMAIESRANDVLIPPTDIRLEEGAAQIVYVVGSTDGDGLDLMLQTIRGLHSAPSGVLTGDGGLGAVPRFPTWAVTVMIAAGATLLVCTRHLLRERAHGQ
jgi:hypothetical protein